MRLLESKRYRDDLKKAISNTDLSELNNKSIFITGGLGLICSAIVDVLLIGCTTNNIVMTVSLILEKTIGKGRLFSGVYYILLGNMIAKNEYHIDRIYLLAIFTASYLTVAFTSFFPIKVIMCITFFLLVISFKATGNGIYFRRTSTIMYYTHMIVFFVLNIIANNEMYGWIGFVVCCVVTNILAYVLNTVKFKNCKLLRMLFGLMTT